MARSRNSDAFSVETTGHDTLATSGNSAVSKGQGKYAGVVEIEREVPVSQTRLLGAEHEGTLPLAIYMAVSLSYGGQR